MHCMITAVLVMDCMIVNGRPKPMASADPRSSGAGRTRGFHQAPRAYATMRVVAPRSIDARDLLVRTVQALAARAGGPQRPPRRDAAPQAHRAAGLRQRRAVLGRLRPRRDLPDPVHSRRGGVRAVLAGRAGRRRGHADRRRVLPPERARLSQRGRGLRGRVGQPRAAGRADRGQCAAGRLCAHRGGLHLLRRAVRRVRGRAARGTRGLPRRDAGGRAHGDQSAGGPGVRRDLRHSHLRLHGRDFGDGGLGFLALPVRRPAAGGERAVRPRARGGL